MSRISHFSDIIDVYNSGDHDFYTANSYIIKGSNQFVCIDPTPGIWAQYDVARCYAVIVQDISTETATALIELRKLPHSCKIYTHWHTAISLRAIIPDNKIVYINAKNYQFVFDSQQINFYFSPYYPAPGSFITLYKDILFSNMLGSSSRASISDDYMDFHGINSPSRFISRSIIQSIKHLNLSNLLPRFGNIITNPSIVLSELELSNSGFLLASIDRNKEQVYSEESEKYLSDLEDEVLTLRKENYELQESIVLANDANIKDELTGFYNESFFLDYLDTIVLSNQNISVLFIRLDKIKELNEEFGSAAGDDFIQILSRELLNMQLPEGIFFRLGGPSCICLLPDADMAAGGKVAEDIRSYMEKSEMFLTHISVSIAMVTVEELIEAKVGIQNISVELARTGKKRLSLLDHMGPGSILKTSQLYFSKSVKGRVVFLKNDPFEAEMYKEIFSDEDIEVFHTSNGSDALRLIDIQRPDVVVSDLFLAEMDAFQIRQRMLASSDLDTIPMILISNQKNDSSILRAQKLEIFHFFKRPYFQEELLGVIRHLIHSKRVSHD